MYDPLTPLIVKAYQKELREKARQDRLVTGHRLWERFFVRVGHVLIATGSRLQRRFEPTLYPGAQVLRPQGLHKGR